MQRHTINNRIFEFPRRATAAIHHSESSAPRLECRGEIKSEYIATMLTSNDKLRIRNALSKNMKKQMFRCFYSRVAHSGRKQLELWHTQHTLPLGIAQNPSDESSERITQRRKKNRNLFVLYWLLRCFPLMLEEFRLFHAENLYFIQKQLYTFVVLGFVSFSSSSSPFFRFVFID